MSSVFLLHTSCTLSYRRPSGNIHISERTQWRLIMELFLIVKELKGLASTVLSRSSDLAHLGGCQCPLAIHSARVLAGCTSIIY